MLHLTLPAALLSRLLALLAGSALAGASPVEAFPGKGELTSPARPAKANRAGQGSRTIKSARQRERTLKPSVRMHIGGY